MSSLARIVVVLAIFLASARPALAQEQVGDRIARFAVQPAELAASLEWLDADAGIVIALRPGALEAVTMLLQTTYPEDKGTIDLVAFGATAALGFHPLREDAWASAGIDTDAPIVVQLAAIDRKAALVDAPGKIELWRTRIVLKTRDKKRARASIAGMRLRKRAQLDAANSSLVGLLGVTDRDDAAARKRLASAGIFWVAQPAPLSGWLFAQEQGDRIVLDLITPFGSATLRWSEHEHLILKTVRRRPRKLDASSTALARLGHGNLAFVLRPAAIGAALEALELDGSDATSVLRRHSRCQPFRLLLESSSWTDLAGSASIDERGALAAHVEWLAKPGAAVLASLSSAGKPVLSTRQDKLLFGATVHLATTGKLRSLPRAPVLLSWNYVWSMADACGLGARLGTMAFAWPELAGLFLDEAATLHPSAKAVVDGLSSAAIVAIADERAPQGFLGAAEAWLPTASAKVAHGWFDRIFGHRQDTEALITWGRGPLRSYSKAQGGGALVGTGVGKVSRNWATGPGLRGQSSTALVELSARPAAFAQVLPELTPGRALLSAFRETELSVHVEGDRVTAHLWANPAAPAAIAP